MALSAAGYVAILLLVQQQQQVFLLAAAAAAARANWCGRPCQASSSSRHSSLHSNSQQRLQSLLWCH
jgi:hypothetical protein